MKDFTESVYWKGFGDDKMLIPDGLGYVPSVEFYTWHPNYAPMCKAQTCLRLVSDMSQTCLKVQGSIPRMATQFLYEYYLSPYNQE